MNLHALNFRPAVRNLGPLLIALPVLVGGCRWLGWGGEDEVEVLDETPVYSVTPETGVWDAEYGRTSDPGDCSFSFKVIRKTDGLVVEATVRDNVVVTDDCATGGKTVRYWNDDTFHCFFDGDHDGCPDARAEDVRIYGGEYALSANGIGCSPHASCPDSFGRQWKGTATVWRRAPKDYVIRYELWFSWASVGLPKPPADDEDVTIGFNACVHDDDTGGRADRALYWRGSALMPYRDESRFETLILKGRKLK